MVPSLPVLRCSQFVHHYGGLVPVFRSVHSNLVRVSDCNSVTVVSDFPLPLYRSRHGFQTVLFRYFTSVKCGTAGRGCCCNFGMRIIASARKPVLGCRLAPTSVRSTGTTPRIVRGYPYPFIVTSINCINGGLRRVFSRVNCRL